MAYETEDERAQIRRWCRFATHLNGAMDTGTHDHISTAAIVQRIHEGDVFDFLARELPTDDISKLTDIDRHSLLGHWRSFAKFYEPQQFHVGRSGLALLVGYVLHLIDIRHVTPVK